MRCVEILIARLADELHVASFNEIIEGGVQFLFTGFRVAVTGNGRAEVAIVLLLTVDEQFDQLG